MQNRPVRLWRPAATLLINLARLALLAMLLLTVVDIGGRFLFRVPVEGATSIITDLLFPALVFLALGNVAEHDAHVRVELLWSRLRGGFGTGVVVVFALAIAAFWTVVAYQAGMRAHEGYVLNQRPIGVVGIPMAVSYGVVAVGSAVGAVASL